MTVLILLPDTSGSKGFQNKLLDNLLKHTLYKFETLYNIVKVQCNNKTDCIRVLPTSNSMLLQRVCCVALTKTSNKNYSSQDNCY